jgi:hypothetical protein
MQQSELPIPMPEIPGYRPPRTQDQHPISKCPETITPAPMQYNVGYSDNMRHRSFQAAQNLPFQQNRHDIYNHHAMLQNSPVTYQPYVNSLPPLIPDHPITLSFQQSGNSNVNQQPPAQVHQRPLQLQPQQNTLPIEPKPQSSNNHGRKNKQTDLLDTPIPENAFGLIGETLLCPFKVTIVILLELYRNKIRRG